MFETASEYWFEVTHIKFDIKMLFKLNKIFELIIEYFIKRLISDRKHLQLVRNYFGGYAMWKGAMELINNSW